MTISLKHAFNSGKTDGADATLVQPSNWNAEHTVTLATQKVMGRNTAGTGAAEEVTADQVLDWVTGTPAAGDLLIRGASAYGRTSFGPFTTLASAATTDLSSVSSIGVSVTGTTTITSLGTGVKLLRIVKFAGILTLTYNATSLILPTSANITTAAGDTAMFVSDGSGNWTCTSYQRVSGVPLGTAAIQTGLLSFGPFTTIASAATTDLSTLTTVGASITGTTTITSLGTGVNLLRVVKFAGILTLTYNATSLILPGAASITTAAGDTAAFLSDASGNWTCFSYERASGVPVLTASQTLTSAQQNQARTNILASAVETGAALGFCTNPFMEISQENGTTSGTVTNVSRYAADQFSSSLSTAGAGTATVQQISDPFSGTANYKRFRSAIRFTTGTAQASLAAGEYVYPALHLIEGNFWKGLGWGTADAASVDVMIVCQASVTGTYSLAIRNAANNRSYLTPISLTANTPTVFFATIPGDTSGTWTTDNTRCVEIWITTGSGSTFQAPANNAWQAGNYLTVNGGGTNLAATAAATFTIAYLNIFPTGVLPYTSASQVDLAHLASMRRPYDDELRRCQRYYATTLASIRFLAAGASEVSESQVLWPVRMRSAPTVSVTSGGTRLNLSSITTPGSSTVEGTRYYIASTAAGDCYALMEIITANARM